MSSLSSNGLNEDRFYYIVIIFTILHTSHTSYLAAMYYYSISFYMDPKWTLTRDGPWPAIDRPPHPKKKKTLKPKTQP